MKGKTGHKCDRMCVAPKGSEQKRLVRTINDNIVTFVRGPAGTGKTLLSVTYGFSRLIDKEFKSLILTRPVVEAGGERLGYLPGNMLDKIDPYMMPIFDALLHVSTEETLAKLMSKTRRNSAIRVLPLAYMRGITFRKSFVVADEMQNSTTEQVRMLLTRLGEGSKIVLCGDTTQSDIAGTNGLENSWNILSGVKGVGFVELTSQSIVRHPLIRQIEERYQKHNRSRRK
ncbi:PhoH family protein [Candidatus Parcubacteria bacterium]|nr:MAG: PhoH family protein [Candidatus Parcubacteria bacterium]